MSITAPTNRFALVASIIFILGSNGCASFWNTEKTYWRASDQNSQKSQDLRQCEYEAERSAASVTVSADASDYEIIAARSYRELELTDSCMRARGYEIRRAPRAEQ